MAETLVSGMSLRLYLHRAFSLIGFADFVPGHAQDGGLRLHHRAPSRPTSGSTPTQGTEGVGRASTRAVVLSSILIILANVVLVRLIFFFFPQAGGA